YRGNTFTCEPVNLLVHRMILSPKGSTFVGRRAEDEKESEFLASTDNWFRPVQVRTGPDGCLWFVDMYRYVIEHPRWIPPEDLARLDVRAGHDMGRIYRIRPKDRAPRPWQRLDKLDAKGLVAALDSPNGWQRDMAMQMLLWKADKNAMKPLEELTEKSKRPEARLYALCALDAFHALKASLIGIALTDGHPGVRRHAIRLLENRLNEAAELGPVLIKLAGDPDAQVRLQLAYSLASWPDARAGATLAKLAVQHAGDPYLTASVLSSVHKDNVADVLEAVFALSKPRDPPEQLTGRMLGIAAALGDDKALPKILTLFTRPRDRWYSESQLAALVGLLEALDRRGQS